MHHYPRHIGDYQKDTTDLSLVEHGAYARLMDWYYAHEQPLPSDLERCYRICGASKTAEKNAVAHVVKRFFMLTQKGYENRRCETVISEYRAKAENSRNNGKSGGRPRSAGNPEKTQQVISGFDLGYENGRFRNPDHNPEETQTKPEPKPITNNQNQENTNTPLPPKGGTASPRSSRVPSEKFDPMSVPVPAELDSPEFLAAWKSWIAHRSEIKAPLKRTMTAKQLESFAEMGVSRSVAMIEHTILKGWQGLREPDRAGSVGPDLFAGVRQSRELVDRVEAGSAGFFLEGGEANDA